MVGTLGFTYIEGTARQKTRPTFSRVSSRDSPSTHPETPFHLHIKGTLKPTEKLLPVLLPLEFIHLKGAQNFASL